jgi:Prokaryotic E2 family E
MRRDFALPEQDTDFLNSTGYRWETVRDSSGNWVFIQDYPVPVGYNINRVKIALRIDAGYPVAQIDMVYFFPELRKLNGGPILALVLQVIEGMQWQRWSRHRTGENPWRPGLDDISTHLQLVNFWMERELNK